jgi:hypothetical protein
MEFSLVGAPNEAASTPFATLFTIVMIGAVGSPLAADHHASMSVGQELGFNRVRHPMRSMVPEPQTSLAGDCDATPRSEDGPHEPRGVTQEQFKALTGLCQTEGLARSPLFPNTFIAEKASEAREPLLANDGRNACVDENAAPKMIEQDWRGLSQDTAFFLGYQGVVAGVLYLLPESETQWTSEQKKPA